MDKLKPQLRKNDWKWNTFISRFRYNETTDNISTIE